MSHDIVQTHSHGKMVLCLRLSPGMYLGHQKISGYTENGVGDGNCWLHPWEVTWDTRFMWVTKSFLLFPSVIQDFLAVHGHNLNQCLWTWVGLLYPLCTFLCAHNYAGEKKKVWQIFTQCHDEPWLFKWWYILLDVFHILRSCTTEEELIVWWLWVWKYGCMHC